MSWNKTNPVVYEISLEELSTSGYIDFYELSKTKKCIPNPWVFEEHCDWMPFFLLGTDFKWCKLNQYWICKLKDKRKKGKEKQRSCRIVILTTESTKSVYLSV